MKLTRKEIVDGSINLTRQILYVVSIGVEHRILVVWSTKRYTINAYLRGELDRYNNHDDGKPQGLCIIYIITQYNTRYK